MPNPHRLFWRRLFQGVLARVLAVVSPDTMLRREVERCGELVDPHFHIAPWFQTAGAAPLVEELASTHIAVGLLYNPYPKMTLPYDTNTLVHEIAQNSDGHVYALASLNTTHEGDWAVHRDAELARLESFLQKQPYVLGTKLAPPHTCLSLNNNPIVEDILETMHQSNSTAKVLGIHIGTTPFCGPLGKQFGLETCCGTDYVDPAHLLPYIQKYPDLTFVLLHSGHEFLPADSPYYYNFRFVDTCIQYALEYDNVWISLSAMFAMDDKTGVLKYPGGLQNLQSMKRANVTHKVIWGSDASFVRGRIHRVLIRSLQAMIRAGFTPEERCWSLKGAAMQAFGIPNITAIDNDETKAAAKEEELLVPEQPPMVSTSA